MKEELSAALEAIRSLGLIHPPEAAAAALRDALAACTNELRQGIDRASGGQQRAFAVALRGALTWGCERLRTATTLPEVERLFHESTVWPANFDAAEKFNAGAGDGARYLSGLGAASGRADKLGRGKRSSPDTPAVRVAHDLWRELEARRTGAWQPVEPWEIAAAALPPLSKARPVLAAWWGVAAAMLDDRDAAAADFCKRRGAPRTGETWPRRYKGLVSERQALSKTKFAKTPASKRTILRDLIGGQIRKAWQRLAAEN